MQNLQRIAAVMAVLVLGLAACSDSSSKIGGSVKGTRITILDQSHKIEADHDLINTKPNLPAIEIVKAWPQAGYGPTHMMPNAAVDIHPKVIWSSGIGSGSDSDFPLLARPVIGNGMLFTMDSEGLVRAFDANNGDRKWEFDTAPPDRDGAAMGGGVGFDNGVLYATTGFGEVIALNAVDGKLIWRCPLLNPIRAAPAIAGGRVYAVSIDNELQAIDVKTGKVEWHHRGITESATLLGASNPAITPDGVIVAYSSGEVFNLRPENGRVAWSYMLTVPTQIGAMPAIADIRGLPVVGNDRIYAISHSGRAAAIDQRTGDRVWEADVGSINTPVVAGDAMFVLSNDGQLVAIANDSGRILWVKELPQYTDPDDHDSDHILWAGPVMAANRLWLGNSQGQLVSFDAANGNQLDSIDLSDPINIPPIVVNNTMYVVLDSGRVVALR